MAFLRKPCCRYDRAESLTCESIGSQSSPVPPTSLWGNEEGDLGEEGELGELGGLHIESHFFLTPHFFTNHWEEKNAGLQFLVCLLRNTPVNRALRTGL